jgi:carbon starvation protein
LFGASNQLLAGLSLVIVTVWLKRSGRAWAYTGIPMLFVLGTAGLSMAVNLAGYLATGNYLLLVVGAIILALEVWVALEGILALRRDRQAALLTKQTSGAA